MSRTRVSDFGERYSERYSFDGNAVKKTVIEYPFREEFELPKVVSVRTAKNRMNCRKMTVSNMCILVFSLLLMLAVFTNYLLLHSQIQEKQYDIARLESKLNDMRIANEEEAARINGSIDLEEIKAIAMNELGMTYPDNGQIVDFEDSDSDYVRQHMDIPDGKKK